MTDREVSMEEGNVRVQVLDPTITISREEYRRLLEQEIKLHVLEAGGVDNWEGYESAMELLDKL
jgi:hypothetical protein